MASTFSSNVATYVCIFCTAAWRACKRKTNQHPRWTRSEVHVKSKKIMWLRFINMVPSIAFKMPQKCDVSEIYHGQNALEFLFFKESSNPLCHCSRQSSCMYHFPSLLYAMQGDAMPCNAMPRYAMLRQQRSREQFSNSQVATRSYNSSMESLLT